MENVKPFNCEEEEFFFLKEYGFDDDLINGNPENINVQSNANTYRTSVENAKDFSEIWEIVKKTVEDSLGKHRIGLSLYLDNLPFQLGAYHPLGTNNIVLNRTLIHHVEATVKSKSLVNAFIYSLLLHEYLHALGYRSETEVRTLIYGISRECFGEDYIITKLAKESPWMLLKNTPLKRDFPSKHDIEIVKDFEKSNQGYIV
jgi:hypothetical protein